MNEYESPEELRPNIAISEQLFDDIEDQIYVALWDKIRDNIMGELYYIQLYHQLQSRIQEKCWENTDD